MDTNKPIMESQETQKLSMQMREEVPPVQYRAIDNMNVDSQPLKVDNSQVLVILLCKASLLRKIKPMYLITFSNKILFMLHLHSSIINLYLIKFIICK